MNSFPYFDWHLDVPLRLLSIPVGSVDMKQVAELDSLGFFMYIHSGRLYLQDAYAKAPWIKLLMVEYDRYDDVFGDLADDAIDESRTVREICDLINRELEIRADLAADHRLGVRSDIEQIEMDNYLEIGERSYLLAE